MSKNQLSFFATKNDLLTALEAAASKAPFSLACLSGSKNEPDVYPLVTDIDDLSIAAFGDQNREKNYLLISPEEKPKMRFVEQRNGETKVFFDQLSHPESVSLKPGGVYKDYECIVAGQIGTVSQNQWSEKLYKLISASLKKQFTKVKSFYVGAEALEKMDQGVRLTTNIRSPGEYDLRR